MFTVDKDSIRFVITRHGINAYAYIMEGDKKVGVIDDCAERIVTPITFINDGGVVRARFLKAAKKAKIKNATSDEYLISEYARKLLAAAEQALEQTLEVK